MNHKYQAKMLRDAADKVTRDLEHAEEMYKVGAMNRAFGFMEASLIVARVSLQHHAAELEAEAAQEFIAASWEKQA